MTPPANSMMVENAKKNTFRVENSEIKTTVANDKYETGQFNLTTGKFNKEIDSSYTVGGGKKRTNLFLIKKDSKNIGTLIDCCWQRYNETVEIQYNPNKYTSSPETQILLNQSTILSCLSYLLKEKT